MISKMKAICVFTGKINGTVHFEQKSVRDSVTIELNLKGFGKKKKEHAIHIHEFGNVSKGCM